ncbi:MAG: hypothetical protein M1825_001750 [Sarcosagium campestre]|nr:MAG: hypothetical protein M1825_001750 [Sarcosagium campestre]
MAPATANGDPENALVGTETPIEADTENERLDLQYEVVKQVFKGKAYFAPLKDPRRILDVGTGTGMWPCEMAEIFPNAQIIGTDLSAIQPRWVPSNVQFVLDDAAEDDWLYPPNHFDYIHTRVLLGSFEDFRDIVKKGFRYTKPGGWMECQEIYTSLFCDDGTMPEDWAFLDWTKTQDAAFMKLGRPLRTANKIKRWMQEAGFVDVHEEVFRVPINSWPREQRLKDIGKFNLLSLLDGLQAFTVAAFSRAFGWTKDEIEVYLVNVRNSMKDRNVHSYHKHYVVWGRKPDGTSRVSSGSTTRYPSQATPLERQ